MRTLTIPLRKGERQPHEDAIAREIAALRSALAATLARCSELEKALAAQQTAPREG